MTQISDPLLDHLGRIVRRDPFPVGLLIDGRYEIRHRIARGGMGEVFYAWDVRLERPVAMKVLTRKLSSPEGAARFESEARLMERIDHPGVVPVYDRGLMPDGRLYFTMKLVEGRTLDEAQEACESREALLETLAAAADIVHDAHERGVIHRDLKPANIMIGEEGRVYVLDWGIACVREASGSTPDGTVMGTVDYMSPEQARGDLASVNQRSDVYSLGAILREISLDPAPPDLEAVRLRAMRRDPASRYASAQEFANDLRRFLRGDSVEARRLSALERVRRHVARHPRRWAIGTVLGLLAVAGLAVLLQKSTRVRREKEALRLLEEGRAALENGRGESAERLFVAALERSPQSALGHYLLGWSRETQGRDAEAEEGWRRALSLDPHFGRAHFRLGRLLMRRSCLARIGSSPQQLESNRSVAEAWARDAAREFDAALACADGFEDALQRDIASAMLAYVRGETEDLLRITGEGIDRWKERSGVEELHWLRSLALDGGPKEQALDRAVALGPQFAFARFSRAVARQQKGDLRDALEDYDAALRAHPRFVEALINRGLVRKALGDRSGAEEDYSAAIEFRPTDPVAYFNRALLREGEAAVRDYDEALRRNPEFAEAYGNRGALLRQGGYLEGALRDYDNLVRLRPEDPSAYRNRGIVRAEKRDFEGARADLEKALDLAPPNWPLRAAVKRLLDEMPATPRERE